MRRKITSYLVVFLLFAQPLVAMQADDDLLGEYETDTEISEISDPIEPLNRIFFQFNDTLYTYLLNPVAETYAAILPEDIRGCIGNAFNNIVAPIRIVNNLLQGKVAQSGTELLRFVINTTAGAGGLADPAKEVFNLHTSDEDFGQTLGKYGFGEGIYICWPIFGPSNIRDTIGKVGDSFLNPLSYIYFDDSTNGLAVHAGKRINQTSLVLGEYEQFIESSFDPYIAMRQFFTDSRRSQILDKHIDTSSYPKQSSFFNFDEADKSAMLSALTDGPVKAVSPERLKSKKYFIQVGVFTDIENGDALSQRLLSIDREPVVVEYIREDYTFYGIQVIGGNEFVLAKNAEQELIKAGFQETLVLSR
nr:VacJ family lipoprotein [Desulfobulbaceae bacterium]